MPFTCIVCLAGSSRSRARDCALCADRVSLPCPHACCLQELSTSNLCFSLTGVEFEWDHGDEEMEGQEEEEGDAEADGDGMEVEGGDDQAAEDTTDEVEAVEVPS